MDLGDYRQLKTLDMSSNLINRIEISSMKYLTSLESLYLKNNFILEIEENSFLTLPKLMYLDISYNKLINPDVTILLKPHRLMYINIDGGNKLNCEFLLKILHRYMWRPAAGNSRGEVVFNGIACSRSEFTDYASNNNDMWSTNEEKLLTNAMENTAILHKIVGESISSNYYLRLCISSICVIIICLLLPTLTFVYLILERKRKLRHCRCNHGSMEALSIK